MKNIFLLIIILIPLNISAQLVSLDYGVKAGINFNSQLNITANIESISNKINIFESRNGQHLGVFLKLSVQNFFLRPELNYTQIKNRYDIPYVLVRTENIVTDFKQNKLDIPLMFGYKIFKNLNILLDLDLNLLKMLIIKILILRI